MVGNELKPTQGKPGDTGASSFPSASHPQPYPQPAQQALPGVFSRGFLLSFLVLCSETARKHLLRRLSHPSFSFLVNFSPALFNLASLEQQATLEPFCIILPLPGAWALASACLFVCLFVFTGFCHILRSGFLLLYVLHQNVKKLFHFPPVKVLYKMSAIFHVTHHVIALDQ